MADQQTKYDADLLRLFLDLIDDQAEREIFQLLLTEAEGEGRLDDIINHLEIRKDDQD